MVNIKAYAPIMFAWIYKKDDLSVIGTGSEFDLKDYADRFYDYACQKYNFSGHLSLYAKNAADEVKRQAKFASDETLAAGFAPSRVLVDGVKMMAANAANRFLPPEKVFTFPF